MVSRLGAAHIALETAKKAQSAPAVIQALEADIAMLQNQQREAADRLDQLRRPLGAQLDAAKSALVKATRLRDNAFSLTLKHAESYATREAAVAQCQEQIRDLTKAIAEAQNDAAEPPEAHNDIALDDLINVVLAAYAEG